jgi:REP element-mobilizing transposase RayT
MPLITDEKRVPLESYISGIIKKRGQKMIAIYCMPDHIHILLGLNGEISISSLVREIKSSSSRHLNLSNFWHFPFRWQVGYGAFSYSNRDLQKLIGYVLEQPIHHKRIGFEEEFKEILNRRKIIYELKYLFG